MKIIYYYNSSKILNEQNKKTIFNNKQIIENLNYVKELAFEIKNCLLEGDLTRFGYLMNDHWKFKLSRSKKMSNRQINNFYNYAMRNGAIGGKLIGAGGGGFLLFYSDIPAKLRSALKNTNLKEVRFKFDFEGVKQIL